MHKYERTPDSRVQQDSPSPNSGLHQGAAKGPQKDFDHLSGFKKALLQNPREMIRRRIFREMIRVSARNSELQAKSRSHRPKVRVTVGQTPNRPETEPESGLGASAENPPLKPFESS